MAGRSDSTETVESEADAQRSAVGGGSAEIPWDRGREANDSRRRERSSGKRPRSELTAQAQRSGAGGGDEVAAPSARGPHPRTCGPPAKDSLGRLALGPPVQVNREELAVSVVAREGSSGHENRRDDDIRELDGGEAAVELDGDGRGETLVELTTEATEGRVDSGDERAASRRRLAAPTRKRSAEELSDGVSSSEDESVESEAEASIRGGRRQSDSQPSAPDASTFSSNRTTSEARSKVRVAPFPKVNEHAKRQAVPLPEVRVPTARPESIRDLFEGRWYDDIAEWLRAARVYELAGRRSAARGLRRPADLVIPPEAVKAKFRDVHWYLVDYLRSDGREPIVTMDEAVWTANTLSAEAAAVFGDVYGDPTVTDRLIHGHRDFSAAERTTVLSVNHLGALKHWEALEKSFKEESDESVGWLLGPLDFLPCFPCRVEPCNGVQQGTKVRVTTNKSWPKPGMTSVLAVNDGIDLESFGAVKFGKVADYSKAVAILMTMEPTPRGEGASASGDDDQQVFLWKVDLTAAYRQLHVHPSCIWNRGKAWLGKVYLDVRAQFGDASQVKSFQDITDMVVGVARLATAGDARAREACADFMSEDLWTTIDARSTEECSWATERAAAGLSGDDLVPLFLMGYIDDFLGAALGRATAVAQCTLVRGILKKLGFPLKEEKTVWPELQMEALGADIDTNTVVTLAESKAESYGQLIAGVLSRRRVPRHELEELVSKLCYAAQFCPIGRSWLTCGFSAIGGRGKKRREAEGATAAATKKRQRRLKGKSDIFIGTGLRRELEWWLTALPAAPGVAFYPKTTFDDATRGEFFFDASTSWGVGGAAIVNETCYFWQHKWRDGEDWHVNVGEGFAEYGSLRLFSAVLPFTDFREHGDNTVANASARKGKTPTRRHAEILRERGLYVMRHSLGTENVYVNTLENKMADPLSRGDDDESMGLFLVAARARGATKFVRLTPDAHLLELADRVSAISHEGDEPERGVDELDATAASEFPDVVAVDETSEMSLNRADADAHGADEPVRFGHISGFAGMDGPAAAFHPLGGVPVAAFDNWLVVRKLWEKIYDARCFGDFDEFKSLVDRGELDELIAKVLIYTAGTPCPDWSAAGLQRGADGAAGGDLWLKNVNFCISCRFPIVLLEQVTGMLDVRNGFYVHKATALLEAAGYLVQWEVIQCNDFGGDGTSRRRIFLVAILPKMLKDGVKVGEFFPKLSGQPWCCLEEIADDIYDSDLVYTGPVNWLDREVRGDASYNGPILLGKIGDGGIGQHVYCASGPIITQKTWGEGEGAASGLYRFKDGVVRRLAPAEAMRAHSFPDPVVLAACSFTPEEQTKLVGNSIPVLSLRRLMKHILSIVSVSQIPIV